jgi:hypothetical protein
MNALKFQFFTIIFIIVLLPFLAAAGSITGTVVDSVTAIPVAGVTVKMQSPVCSTQTSATGSFSLTVVTTEVSPYFFPQKVIKIFYDPSSNSFAGIGDENFFIEVRNTKGQLMAKENSLSSGQYFAAWKFSGAAGIFKFSRIAGQNQVFCLEGKSEVARSGFAKSAAGYVLSFLDSKYKPFSLTANLGQNLTVYLSPLAAVSDSARVNFGVGIDTLGTANITVIIPKN